MIPVAAGARPFAMVLFEKLDQHQPAQPQAERYANEGVPISLSTLADQVGGCTAALMRAFRTAPTGASLANSHAGLEASPRVGIFLAAATSPAVATEAACCFPPSQARTDGPWEAERVLNRRPVRGADTFFYALAAEAPPRPQLTPCQ